jgi:hypothetical protein
MVIVAKIRTMRFRAHTGKMNYHLKLLEGARIIGDELLRISDLFWFESL